MALPIRTVYNFNTNFLLPNIAKVEGYGRRTARHFEPTRSRKPKEGEFRVLELYPRVEKTTKNKKTRSDPNPPRSNFMTTKMAWSNLWPGPKTYHPASCPLPIRQGCNKKGPPPDRFANTELMKIPNFLHLTPPAVEKHCKAIKKFCTPWPEGLETKEDMDKHFPIRIKTSDYCHSSPSIRDPNARVVTLEIKLEHLELDKHAKDKFLRLVAQRYNPKTGYVTITADSCPIKKQNYDYAHYLLTAVYFESWKTEDWESKKGEKDMETYIFSERKSFRNVKQLFEYNNRELPKLDDFGKAVEDYMNNGDKLDVMERYKVAAQKLLSLPPLESKPHLKHDTRLS